MVLESENRSDIHWPFQGLASLQPASWPPSVPLWPAGCRSCPGTGGKLVHRGDVLVEMESMELAALVAEFLKAKGQET
jgi:hypothetical protein